MAEAGTDDPWMFWLNLTNVVLGVVVLGFVMATVLAVVVEFAVRAKRKLGTRIRGG